MELVFDVHIDACSVCGGSLRPFEVFEYQQTTLTYVACTRCGLVLMDPRPSAASLDALYEYEYRRQLGDEAGGATGDAQRRRAVQQAGFIGRRPRRHLDIGSSLGELLREVGASVQVGVEPGVQHRERLAASGIEVFETVEALAATDPEPFDLISMSHVLEHLDDPVAFLPSLVPLLAPDGELFVEVPYLYRSVAYTTEHLAAFTKPTLASTLRAGGFAVTRRAVHRHRQGGMGMGRNLAVLATPAPAVAPAARSVNVRWMQWRRVAGYAPQQFYRWRRHQQRRLVRHAYRLIGRDTLAEQAGSGSDCD